VANKSRLISPCARRLRGWLAPSRRGPRGRSPGAAAARAVLSRPDAQLGIRLRGSVPVALTVLGAVILSTSMEVNAAHAATAPCGSLASAYNPLVPPTYQHVVVIMDENLSYAKWQNSSQASYTHGLAAACGSERFFHVATHPSQPNYMATTSGIASPVATKSSADNVFHQAKAAGNSWKSYEESMSANCAGSAGFYKTGHNPAFWYTDLRSPGTGCVSNDVPLSPALGNDIASDSLPTFSWITPNLCNDMHWLTGCPAPQALRIATGDTWLAKLIPQLTALPSYRSGSTLIVLTWDEGSEPSTNGIDCVAPAVYTKDPSCQVPAIVISPYIVPGTTDATNHNLYGLLRTTQDILGYGHLNGAAGQSSLRPGLGF
jgi:Phosphoesterase family